MLLRSRHRPPPLGAGPGIRSVPNLRDLDGYAPGVNYVWLNVLADLKGTNVAEVEALLSNLQKGNEVLGGCKAEALFIKVSWGFHHAPQRKQIVS
jgi:hypothetical protein